MCRKSCKRDKIKKENGTIMGMAASQARLLTITARLHDVEYQAQSIQNAKTQLATQSDEVYQAYLEALDATTLTVKDYDGNIITANFNNLWGRNAVDTKYQYAIRDDHNRLVVSEDIKQAYDNYKHDKGDAEATPYGFAMYMLGGAEDIDLNELDNDCDEVYAEISNNKDITKTSNYSSIKAAKDKMDEIIKNAGGDYNDLNDEDKDKYDKAEKTYYNLMYNNYGEEIYKKNVGLNASDESDFNKEDFTYYENIFKQIEAADGCVSITKFDGPMNGDAANDSDWLKNQLESGRFTIEIVETDKKTGEVKLNTTSIATDSYVGTTTTTSIDKKAYAKAEAQYEHDTKLIDAKDKKYDMDLSKLETERTALTTEYDSVKKVVSDNIERTFGIFS